MPSITIKGNQVVYYEKTIELPEDEFQEITALYKAYEEGDSLTDVMQWLADGDSGFTEDDAVEWGEVEDFELEAKA
jgi:hypothetical protein